jgi:hypothetical protein
VGQATDDHPLQEWCPRSGGSPQTTAAEVVTNAGDAKFADWPKKVKNFWGVVL